MAKVVQQETVMTQTQLEAINKRAVNGTDIDSFFAEGALDWEKLGPYNYGIHKVGSFYREEDAMLLIHARTDILELVAEVQRLQRIVKEIDKGN